MNLFGARVRTFVLVWLMILSSGLARESSAISAPHVDVDLVFDRLAVETGVPLVIATRFRLEKGWHLYWKNPGDSGQPPKIDWALPLGITAADLVWPAPHRIKAGPLINFGYEDSLILSAQLQVPPGVPVGGNAKFEAEIKWLVCRELCIPGSARLEKTLPVVGPGAALPSSDMSAIAKARAAAPVAWPLEPIAAGVLGDRLVLSLNLEESVKSAEFFPEMKRIVDNGVAAEVSTHGKVTEIGLKLAEDHEPIPNPVRGILRVEQGPPFWVEAPLGQVAVKASSGSVMKLFRMLLLAFFGGLILNLMPCVFPVLSIKIMSLLPTEGRPDRKGVPHAFAYTAGILVSFWLLVSVLLILRASTGPLGWGFQFQNPGFLSALALILGFFGLNLVGVFDIQATFSGVGSGLAQKDGWVGAFFTGVLATIVATPCTAPFMGTAIAFALTESAPVCFAIFTALGLGLAAPYLAFAFLPSSQRFLPRPGRWMESLKQGLGFLVLATVIWVLWIYGQTSGVNGMVKLLSALLFVGMASWILGRWPAKKLATISAVMVGLAAIGIAFRSSAQPADALTWEPYSKEKIAQYRKEGRPVFVDFTADWCVSCKVNEAVVFGSKEVIASIASHKISLLKADWTTGDPKITEAIASFGRIGVPLYVLHTVTSETPTVFPEVISPGLVLKEFDKLK